MEKPGPVYRPIGLFYVTEVLNIIVFGLERKKNHQAEGGIVLDTITVYRYIIVEGGYADDCE